MVKASVAIQVLPGVREDSEIIRIVDEVIAFIKSKGLNTVVGPFETTIEGEYGELMDIVRECQLICLKAGAPSVMSYIKIALNEENGVFTINEKISKHS